MKEVNDKSLNQSGNGTLVAEAVKLAQGLKPNNSGMTVGTQLEAITAKPVDRRTIEGSYNGQTVGFDEVGDVVKLPANPGPRDPRGQATVFSSKLQAASEPSTVIGGSEADQS